MAGVKGRCGGARPNSGPARQRGSVRWQREQKRARKQPAAASRPVVARAAVCAPDEMPADQLAVWEQLASHATAAGTLTAATAFAFAELCEAIVLKRTMLTQIQGDGYTHVKVSVDGAGVEHQELKAHPLIAKFQAQMVRVEAGMARFLVTGTGKPAAVVEAPADDFAEFDGLTLVKGGK